MPITLSLMSKTEGAASAPVDDIPTPEDADLDAVDVTLGETGKQFPRIVDVSWRLSLITNTSTAKKLYEPTYLINLTVSDAGKIRDIQFECNAEEMGDFVQKLKEATSQVERTTTTSQ